MKRACSRESPAPDGEIRARGTRWLFVLGPGRSGTTLLSDLLNRSSRIYIAPETKYFQQIWSQRHLLRLLPRERRVRAVVRHLITSEYPADPPTFPRHRDRFLQILRQGTALDAAFPQLLRTLSDRPVIGEKTPWHTFFVDEIVRVASDARFLAITRDAPATVASTWQREGFRRVDTLVQCIARWIFMNRELLNLRDRLPRDRFQLLRFEDLVREPARVMRSVCGFLDVRLEPAMLTPTFQDSSHREEGTGEGFDPGVLSRWKEALTAEQIDRIRAHTWRISESLGYSSEPARASGPDRIRVGTELALLRAAVALMRSGWYPFGPVASVLDPSGIDATPEIPGRHS